MQADPEKQTSRETTDTPKTTALRRIIVGLGYIDGYGHHPGWPSFIGLVVVGCAISLWVGAANAVVFGSILCIGAYERAKESGL